MTQTIKAIVGSGAMTREFSATATNGQWSGNILVDSVASTNLGLVMPNQTIDTIQCAYEKGGALFRIQSSQTLMQKRYGFASKLGYSCWASSKIPTYKVQPDDIINVFPVPDAGTGSNAIAWATTTRGFESMVALNVADNTDTELKTTTNNQSIGDYAFNATMTGLCIQITNGKPLYSVEIIDQTGGVIWKAFGANRTPADGGSINQLYNFEAKDMKIPILKGYTLKIKTIGN